MNDQTLDLYATIHQSAKLSIASLDMYLTSNLEDQAKSLLVQRQNRYKQIAAKAGQALQEYSESTVEPSIIPQVATQTNASLTTLTNQVTGGSPADSVLYGFQTASGNLSISMELNTEATQNARNLAFTLLEMQQNELYDLSQNKKEGRFI